MAKPEASASRCVSVASCLGLGASGGFELREGSRVRGLLLVSAAFSAGDLGLSVYFFQGFEGCCVNARFLYCLLSAQLLKLDFIRASSCRVQARGCHRSQVTYTPAKPCVAHSP